ncbi:hypothetical protein [Kluyvera georgiana]|nr:hypothetical protein [Kluyvera georgiana]
MKQLLDFIIGSCVDNRTKFQLLVVCYPKCKADEVMLILRWRVADLYAHELEAQSYLFRELEGIIEKITDLPETYFVSSYKSLLTDDFRELTAAGADICKFIMKNKV